MEHGYLVEIWRIVTDNAVYVNYPAGMYNGSNYCEINEKDFPEAVKNNLQDGEDIFIEIESSLLLEIPAKHGFRTICLTGLWAYPVPDMKQYLRRYRKSSCIKIAYFEAKKIYRLFVKN